MRYFLEQNRVIANVHIYTYSHYTRLGLAGKTAEQTETDGAAENYDILKMTFSAVSVSVSVNRSREKWRPLVGIRRAYRKFRSVLEACHTRSALRVIEKFRNEPR